METGENRELSVPSIKTTLTAAQIRANVNLVQEVMKAVMKKGEHYGLIPGCGTKPTLLKSGAEKLLTTFMVAAEPEIQDLSTQDEIRFRVVCRGIHQGTQITMGAGVGECSSSEEKYKWRAAVCDEEFGEAAVDRRREKWVRNYGGNPYRIKQVRTNPPDLANTILKMAKKRALVDLALTVTAASDIFTQDIEDMPEELLGGKEPVKMPTAKTAPQMPQDGSGKSGDTKTPPAPQESNQEPAKGQENETKGDSQDHFEENPNGEGIFEGKITSTDSRSGYTKKGVKWTLFSAYTSKSKFGTFDPGVAELIRKAKESGAVVQITFKPPKKGEGKEIVEIRLKDAPVAA